MELKIGKNVIEYLSGKLLHDINIECVIIEKYSFVNSEIDYYDMIANEILKHHFGEEHDRNSWDVYNFVKETHFISIITKFIETIGIMLLNQTKEVDFSNIVYSREDEENYYFKIIRRKRDDCDS